MLPKAFNFISLLSGFRPNKKTISFRRKQIIFSHGDPSDSIFYVEKGTVKLTITSANGKEAFIGLLNKGDFFGESCVASGRPTRFHTASAVTDMQVLKIDSVSMMRILRMNAEFSCAFTTYLVRRAEKIQQDLADSLLDSSEERLARVLASLSQLGQDDKVEFVPRLTQQDLAHIIGVSRQRVNFLMKRLKKSASAGSSHP